MTNGKTYGIYRVRPLLRSAISIRKDWLAKVGLPAPQSVPDLYRSPRRSPSRTRTATARRTRTA